MHDDLSSSDQIPCSLASLSWVAQLLRTSVQLVIQTTVLPRKYMSGEKASLIG